MRSQAYDYPLTVEDASLVGGLLIRRGCAFHVHRWKNVEDSELSVISIFEAPDIDVLEAELMDEFDMRLRPFTDDGETLWLVHYR